MSMEIILLATFAFFLAGIVKGSVSIGLPTAALGVLSMAIDPRIAIALIPFPILVANFRQMMKAGHIVETAKKYAPYTISLVIFLLLVSQLVPSISTNALLIALGVVIVTFAITNLFFQPPKLPDRYDTIGQIIAGIISGIFGGLTSLWGPPMLIYLLARGTEKEEFIRATGVILFIGVFPLTFGFWRNGMLDDGVWLVSIFLTIPAMIGFALGEWFRKRMDADRFRKAVLVMFLLIGLNLLRRAIFG